MYISNNICINNIRNNMRNRINNRRLLKPSVRCNLRKLNIINTLCMIISTLNSLFIYDKRHVLIHSGSLSMSERYYKNYKSHRIKENVNIHNIGAHRNI